MLKAGESLAEKAEVQVDPLGPTAPSRGRIKDHERAARILEGWHVLFRDNSPGA